ncbi:MAG: M15 family metallopeptidase [Prevotella sp.]|nr:M15 family metallopeptidase [Prevotella sp.]
MQVLVPFMASAQTAHRPTKSWQAGAVVSAEQLNSAPIERWFTSEPIPAVVFARMRGKSYPDGCTVPRSSLRYLRLLHVDVDGKVRTGEMVCNKAIAADLISIFRTLYEQRYPIHSIRLIDDFGADDERSMRANNTSSFCFRQVKGSRKLSAHARGMAVDINALYNPYYRRLKNGREVVQPANARAYCNRSQKFPYKIERGDLLHRLFLQHGFRWGGAWRTVKDYQHFEK